MSAFVPRKSLAVVRALILRWQSPATGGVLVRLPCGTLLRRGGRKKRYRVVAEGTTAADAERYALGLGGYLPSPLRSGEYCPTAAREPERRQPPHPEREPRVVLYRLQVLRGQRLDYASAARLAADPSALAAARAEVDALERQCPPETRGRPRSPRHQESLPCP